jgi:hypothetical protein
LNLTDPTGFGPIPWQPANLGRDIQRHEAAEYLVPRCIDGEHRRSPLALGPVPESSDPAVPQHFGRGVGHRTRGNVAEGRLTATVSQPEQTTNCDDPGQLCQPDEREELPK